MIDGISMKPSSIQRRHKYIQNKGMQKGYNSSLERRLRHRGGTSFPRGDGGGRRGAHSMPESASALWRMVSLTAAKTRRMFDVSVACVRLRNRIVSVITSKMQFPFYLESCVSNHSRKEHPALKPCMHPAAQARKRRGITH